MAELALGLAVVVSAIATVYAKHESRKLYSELQVLQRERDRLEMEWGQLQIEQSAWSTHARVERMAREEIGMGEPRPEQLRMLP
ncbi:MAG: cell division protein FtsL [Chromatiales bacterium]|nr:MAG: cell division protein FtsL [Chromatiales bacterium]